MNKMAQDKEVKKEVVKIDATNPFNKGVTYEMFLKELGSKSIKTYLKDKCSKEQIEWIESEIKQFKNK